MLSKWYIGGPKTWLYAGKMRHQVMELEVRESREISRSDGLELIKSQMAKMLLTTINTCRSQVIVGE